MELSKRASLPERDVSSKELALDIVQYSGREGSDRRAKESDSGAQESGPFEKATVQERGDEDLARGEARHSQVEEKTGNPIAHQSATSDNEASNNYELDQAVTDINAQAYNAEGARAATQSADQPQQHPRAGTSSKEHDAPPSPSKPVQSRGSSGKMP